MVYLKEAVAEAMAFAKNVLEPSRIGELRLEEVEMTKVNGEDIWLITLSMPKELSGKEFLAGLRPRDYKIFSVSAQNGQVLSMKIRELASTE